MDLLAWYPWFKAIHVMSVIAWMAALLYLPRLFVYHAERGAPGAHDARGPSLPNRHCVHHLALFAVSGGQQLDVPQGEIHIEIAPRKRARRARQSASPTVCARRFSLLPFLTPTPAPTPT